MKKLLFVFVLIALSHHAFSQKEGSIKYKETIKLDIKMEDIPGIDIKSMLPESTTFQKELIFTENESLYQTLGQEEQEDTELNSDDGSFKMVISYGDELPEILYTNLKENAITHQKGFMGKSFVINSEREKRKWKVTGEKIKYLDYECMKATSTTDDGKSIVAWFTPQIPTQVGPSKYGQLPGAILMVSINDGKTEIMATEVNLGTQDQKIKQPSDGKKVDQETFDKIVDERMKELEQSSGAGTVIIRN